MTELFHLFWVKTKESFERELKACHTFHRSYLQLQECDYTKELAEDLEKIIIEQKPRLDYWRPYISEAINRYLGKPYVLETYSDTELKNIISLMDEAIQKNLEQINNQ